MTALPIRDLTLDLRVERFPYHQPFRISGHVFTETALLVAELSDGVHAGRGEGAGVYYLGDDIDHMVAEASRVRGAIERGATRVDDFLARQVAFVAEQVAKVQAAAGSIGGVVTHACPKCSAGFLRRIPKRAGGFFWGCSRHSEGCDGAFSDVDGKPQTVERAIPCPACRLGKLRKASTDRGTFWACTRYKEGCKFTLPDAKGRPSFRPQAGRR